MRTDNQGSERQGRWRTGVIAATLTVLLTVLIAPSAFASPFGGGSNDTGQPPPGSHNPGNPPPPSGGGSTQPPTYKYLSTVSTAAGIDYTYGCAATNNSGGNWVGVRWRYRYPASLSLGEVHAAIRGGDDTMATAGVTRLNKVCLYDGSWRDETLKCVLYSTATAKMILPRSATLASNTTRSSFGNGNRSIDACKASKSQAYVEVTPKDYGRYRIDAFSRAVNMVVRTPTSPNQLTGVWEAPRILSVSGEYNTNPMSRDGYLACDVGFREGTPTRNYSWTASDCLDIDTPTALQCHVGDDPTVTWRDETWQGRFAELLRDGSDVRMQWDTPRISGNGLKQVVSERSRMVVKDAPWSNQQMISKNFFGLQRNSARQNALTSADGTNWSNGLTTTWTAQWYQATTDPTVLTPQYGFTADFEKTSVRIRGLDDAGRFILEPTTVTVRADAVCTAPSLQVETLRVVNH